MAEKKEKQYVSDNAQLMAEWDWDRNLNFNPSLLTCGSNVKVWWKCSNEHFWEAKICNRSNGSGCPYCSGRSAVMGINDLKTVNPELATEWNDEKNCYLSPSDVLPNSNKKVWWKCKKGHEWQATINNRTNGCGCPYCSGQKVLLGYNDLQTVNPLLATEWDYNKNGNLKPEHFTSNSRKKVWWKCKKGHEWQAMITDRNKGTGCPVCKSERNTSFPEYAILYYLEKNGLEAIHLYKANGYELDIYVPSKNIAIEYDGYYWHKGKTGKDLEKNFKCKKDGIKLYRIREGLPSLDDSSTDYIIQKNQSNLSDILEQFLSKVIGKNIKVNIQRDSITIENLREHLEKENSILRSSPEIAQEWNYEKNGDLKPEYFTSNSGKKVWWKCRDGHEWQATIDNRRKGKKCPYCSGRYSVKGKSDLQTLSPDLSKEWNYEKNNGLTPTDVTPHSDKKVWWRCARGHEWEAKICNRTNGRGCPYCAGRYVIKSENDLQTLNLTLANEWNYEKNNGLTPSDVMPGSHIKVWWKCIHGHEWQATISSRNNGRGCPYCAGQRLIQGQNDLQTSNPSLAKEWNYEKNNGLRPADVMPNSNKKAWWKCSNGHEWEAIISNRNKGHGCPECAKVRRKNGKV